MQDMFDSKDQADLSFHLYEVTVLTFVFVCTSDTAVWKSNHTAAN